MGSKLRKVRYAAFALAFAGSLGFGATQVAAAPRDMTLECSYPDVWLGVCPGGNGSDCGQYCELGEGTCLKGCCRCVR